VEVVNGAAGEAAELDVEGLVWIGDIYGLAIEGLELGDWEGVADFEDHGGG
jgi:hypothetical protein